MVLIKFAFTIWQVVSIDAQIIGPIEVRVKPLCCVATACRAAIAVHVAIRTMCMMISCAKTAVGGKAVLTRRCCAAVNLPRG